MLIDIHRAANVERHNYLLDQAGQWRLAKLADLIRRTRKAEKKAVLQPIALLKSEKALCCNMGAA